MIILILHIFDNCHGYLLWDMMSIYAAVNLIQSCKVNVIIFYLFKDLFAFL